ncbi:MAG: signal peptidase II [Candidatus Zixiibacteriota bacterium]
MGLVVIADQATKLWAVAYLADKTSVSIIGDFLMFTLVYNEGGAMGTQIGPSAYYLVMALIVLPFVGYYIYRHRYMPAISLPLAFIAGGAVGNLIDRIRLGQVVDFIDVDFFDISIGSFQLDRWWTFNVADSCISCSIVFLLAYMFVQRKGKDHAPKLPADMDSPSPLAG